ncbi:hypothetical protein ANANG_G00129390 [Anguilla anguilla]|uniref:Transferrin-like domain-containing protein n=1 Tax=Anguilla anguilla TaxID=7936 RepID=A0A9D3S2D3_ANGAN|nr:hypothetical protein ANANG_G00129390 [Anguilla anguilla]
MKAVVSLLLIGCLASALAAPPVKWCAQSEAEKKKCDDLAGKNELKDLLTCVQKEGADGCIKAIKVSGRRCHSIAGIYGEKSD